LCHWDVIDVGLALSRLCGDHWAAPQVRLNTPRRRV